jgi:hypothetical protein
MKALVICPADRPAVAQLAEQTPLVLAPLLGRSVLEYWLEALAARGAKHVTVLASDRPGAIRAALAGGTKWGVQVEVLPQHHELTVEEARARYRPTQATDWLPEQDVVLLDTLPGQPELPLFESYGAWFAAVQAWMRHAVTPARIGAREIHPGVWVGLHAQIAPTAQLHPPCWIGEHAIIGAGAVIGPGAVLDDRAVVERGARVVQSIVAPETFVGEMTLVLHSLAHGNLLINWQTNSALRVPDAFLLSSLQERRGTPAASSLPARMAALAAMLAAAPFALAVMGLALLRGESPLQLRLGVRARRGPWRGAHETFAYYELAGARNWLRRWPQFWSVVRGDLVWFGNRPLRPTQALGLNNDFERLWLAVPPGLVSLADAHGCPEGVSDESCAHASYYAVNASRRLNWFILSRSFLRAASAWPLLRWTRRAGDVALPQLMPKQQG